jgi:cell shape-determining protein MreC
MSWGAIALSAALLFLLVRLLAPNLFWTAFAPAFRASDTFARASHTLLSNFGNVASLTLQNEKLSGDNATLAVENESLRQKLESVSGLVPDMKSIVAGVVARPPESPYDALVLAAGSGDGVALGMEVFGAGDVPLGTVSSVFSHFSRVTLFSSPGASVLGSVGEKHLPIIVEGEGAGAIGGSVSRAANIVVGDVVSVPGPGSLPIGTVARVDSDPSSPSVTLRITPMVSIFSVMWVTVRDTGKSLSGLLASTTPRVP